MANSADHAQTPLLGSLSISSWRPLGKWEKSIALQRKLIKKCIFFSNISFRFFFFFFFFFFFCCCCCCCFFWTFNHTSHYMWYFIPFRDLSPLIWAKLCLTTCIRIIIRSLLKKKKKAKKKKKKKKKKGLVLSAATISKDISFSILRHLPYISWR